MKRIDTTNFVPYEDANLPNKPYVFADDFGNDIVVKEFVEEKHSPHDTTILKDPYVYNNLWHVVKNADASKISSETRDGIIKKFKSSHFLVKINHPAKETKKNLAMVVAVEYGKDGYNHVVTYYDKPEGAIW